VAWNETTEAVTIPKKRAAPPDLLASALALNRTAVLWSGTAGAKPDDEYKRRQTQAAPRRLIMVVIRCVELLGYSLLGDTFVREPHPVRSQQ